MSSDKSKLKTLFHAPPLSDAVQLVAVGERYRRANHVRTIFEDGAIRASSITSSLTGAAVYLNFTRAIDAAFLEYPSAHTYVLVFDDKRWVPSRKAATQAKRRAALAASIQRNATTWQWDGHSAIVDAASHIPLPPWESVRVHAAAYRRALEDIALMVLARYVPPPGRRLIVDTTDGRRVLETTLDGMVLTPYDDTVPKPRIGEADIAAQHYAMRACLVDEIPERNVSESRAGVPFSTELLPYYAPECSDAPHDGIVLPGRSAVHYAIDTSVVCRRVYEAGDVVLRTTDTDFLPLGLVAQSRVFAAGSHRRVHVGLGATYLCPDTTERCTRTTVGARLHSDMYDMALLVNVVRRTHASTVDTLPHDILSFVAFCAACGNDYTKRLLGFSHQSMYAAYTSIVASGTRLVTPASPHVSVPAFVHLVRTAVFNRMPVDKRPISWDNDVASWAELAARTPMPSIDEFLRYFEQVAWSLVYATAAVHGIEHVPDPFYKMSGESD